jgi:hypothetical protein
MQSCPKLSGYGGRQGIAPAVRLNLELLTDEARQARGFRWADETVGHRSQLGGEPNWIGPDETPRCSACHEPMMF